MRNFTTLILTLLLTLCGATTAQAQTFVTYAQQSTPANEIVTGNYVIKAKYKDCTPRWMYAKTTETSGQPSNIFFSETLNQNNLDNVWHIEKREDGSFYMMHLGTATYLCLGYNKNSEDTGNNNNCHLRVTNDKSAATYCSARTAFTDGNGRKMDENAFIISAGAPSSTGNRHHFVIYNGDMSNRLSSWADAIGNESVDGTQVQFNFFKAELDYTALQQAVPTMCEGCTYYLQGANGYYVTSSATYTTDQSNACPFFVKKTDDDRFELYTSNGESHCTISDRLYIVTKTSDDIKKVYFSINPVSGTDYFTINNFNTGGNTPQMQYLQNGTSNNVGKGTDPTAENARWKFVPANDAATEAASLTANVQTGDAVHGNVTTFSASYPVAIPNGYKAYTATYDNANNVINVTELAGKVIPANTGVLLRGEVNASLSIKPTMQTGTAVEGNVLTAVGDADKTFDTTTDTKIYLLGKQDGNLCFRHMSTSGTQTIGKHKAYINLSGVSNENLATLRIRFDGEATGINDATMTQQGKDNSVFDLSGRRVSRPTHGIYIKGGKKVIF